MDQRANLHADIQVAHLIVHVLMLLEVPICPPHVPEPQQDVQDQHRTDEDDEHKRHCLQAAVLGSHCTVRSGGDGFALHRTHLVICTAPPTSAPTGDDDGRCQCMPYCAHMSAYNEGRVHRASAQCQCQYQCQCEGHTVATHQHKMKTWCTAPVHAELIPHAWKH